MKTANQKTDLIYALDFRLRIVKALCTTAGDVTMVNDLFSKSLAFGDDRASSNSKSNATERS